MAKDSTGLYGGMVLTIGGTAIGIALVDDGIAKVESIKANELANVKNGGIAEPK